MPKSGSGTIQYVYHAVPKSMLGTTLYPLHTLRDLYPEAYDVAVKKYEWRQHFLELIIPKLGCRWNDVLHMTIIHPREIFKELKNSGYVSPNAWEFFEVPLAAVIGLPYAVYHSPPPFLHAQTYTREHQAPQLTIDPNRVKLPGEYDFRHEPFPQSTRDYFKFEISHGRLPLAFNGLPHFLLRAPLDSTGLRRVAWHEPDQRDDSSSGQ